MEITLTSGLIITCGGVLAVIVTVIGYILKGHNWYLKQEEQEEKIEELKAENKEMKKENALICFALSACLDGLMQLGANHTVPDAKDKLDKYLNQQAHK